MNLELPMNRRSLLRQAGTGLMICALPISSHGASDALGQMLRDEFADMPVIYDDRVTIDLPALAENGNSVKFGVAVTSPMTDEDHVVSVDVFAEKNPSPHIGRFYFSPASGRATINTRIRLGASQQVAAVARMSDGTLHGGAAEIVVTEAACLDFLI